MFTKHANNWVFLNIIPFIDNHKIRAKKGYFGDFQVTFYFCNTNISEFFDLTKSWAESDKRKIEEQRAREWLHWHGNISHTDCER